MLCTNNLTLLNSSRGRTTLQFRQTTRPPKYDPAKKSLIITWDVFMQNYRAVSTESCQLISTLPANDSFWEYFDDKIINMTPQQKTAFMDV